MSKPSEKLLQIRADLDVVLTKRNEGTADFVREVPRIDTAMQRALDRSGAGSLPTDGERGGSSSPKDVDERRMAERVARQAAKDAHDIGVLVARMKADAATLRHITDRQAEVVDGTKNTDAGLPGCRSCARKEDDNGVTIGGQWAEVYEKSKASGLCRDCWEFESAMDAIPPVKWCHLLHTQKKRAANRWLALNHPELVAVAQKRAKVRSPKKPKLCGHPTGKDGAPCARRLMHQGECLPAAEIARLETVPPSR